LKKIIELLFMIFLLATSVTFVACAADDDDDDADVTATDDDDDGDPEAPENAVISYTCSVYDGFNFEPDTQETVGVLNSLTIGETVLTDDLVITDPENPDATISVVGVMSSILWEGGYADPIGLGAQVGTMNKNSLSSLLHMDIANTNVEFEFTVYQYDREQRVYYKAFHSDDTIVEGILNKSGGELELHLDDAQNDEVQQPQNYALELGIAPLEMQQALTIAVAPGMSFVKPWGVDRTAK
jgi:hypothetical protein